ncbi:MAG TPA: sulfurtransferase [Jiangellaceae bacterium]|nr:sulfurtransferase [Jiangellaceae bacterium]
MIARPHDAADNGPTGLIGVAELARLMGSERLVLLDVRWALDQPDGREPYLRGHLPGAVYVDLDTELSGPASTEAGRHPLPDVDSLQAAARRWGANDESVVVAYDDVGQVAAARAWWLLRWGGFRQVRVLDGGLAAWRAYGGVVETDDVHPPPGSVSLTPGNLPVLDADASETWAHHGVLLDARPAERYRGETDPYDPRPGHIPGARSAPSSENLEPNGAFRSPEHLRRRFAELGVLTSSPVAVYCGSGVAAAQTVLALNSIGVDAALYPGSWSQWSREDSRPVVTGSEPH